MHLLFFAPIWAASAAVAAPAADPAQMPGPLAGVGAVVPYLLIFMVIYLLVVRPSSQQRQAQQAMLQGLKKGDEVITSSGVYGRIVSLEEKVAVLEVADKVRIRLLRDRIASLATLPAQK